MEEFKGKITECPEGYCIVNKIGEDHWEIEKVIDYKKLQETLDKNNKILADKLNGS